MFNCLLIDVDKEQRDQQRYQQLDKSYLTLIIGNLIENHLCKLLVKNEVKWIVQVMDVPGISVMPSIYLLKFTSYLPLPPSNVNKVLSSYVNSAARHPRGLGGVHFFY